jgi:serine/threonine protein kinase/tetratricopeptide (TPR) repeat protein
MTGRPPDTPPRPPDLHTAQAYQLPRELPERPDQTYAPERREAAKTRSLGEAERGRSQAIPGEAAQQPARRDAPGDDADPILPRGAFASWVVSISPEALVGADSPHAGGDFSSIFGGAWESGGNPPAREAAPAPEGQPAPGISLWPGVAVSAEPPEAGTHGDMAGPGGEVSTARPASDLPIPPLIVPGDGGDGAGSGCPVGHTLATLPLGDTNFASSAALPSATPDGRRHAQFELRRVVGRGGMGEVWEAVQTSLGRPVAVKTIRPDLLQSNAINPGANARIIREFEQEALISARLEHPNIAPVHDLGAAGPGMPPMLAMKLVRGDSWHQMLQIDLAAEKPADLLAKHLPILEDMAQAVAFAHSQGIIHRDLKPEQVMVGPFGETLLMDWGLAVQVEEIGDLVASPSRRSGGLPPLPTLQSASNPAGTPAMMAPEQTSDTPSRLGPWTDVYLLGGTLYYILTGGIFPHQAKSSLQALRLAMLGRVDPPREVAPDRYIPDELAALAMKAMEEEPEDRVPSVQEFLRALRDFSTGASRRRESEAITDDGELMLRGAGAELGREGSALGRRHRSHAKIGAELARAIELWPGNRRARELAAENLAQRIAAEIETGDLAVARVHLAELRDVVAERAELSMVSVVADSRQRSGAQRGAGGLMALDEAIGDLATRLEAAVVERERQRRQRIMSIWAVIALLIALGGGASFFAYWSQRANTRIASEKQRAEDALLVAEEQRKAAEAAREVAIAAQRQAERNATAAQELGDGANALVLYVLEQLNSEMEKELTPERGILADDAQDIRGAVTASVARRVVDYFNGIDTARLTRDLRLEHAERSIAAANLLQRFGLFDSALELTTSALSLQRATEPQAYVMHSAALQLRASVEMWIGDRERALETLDEAFAPYGVSSLDELSDPDARIAYRGLLGTRADILWQLARYDEAIADGEAVLRYHEAKDDFLSEQGMQAISNLALMLSEKGSPDRAREMHLRNIAQREAADRPDDPELATAYNNYAMFLRRLGEFDEALVHQERALALWRDAFGMSHQSVASGYNNLGLLLRQAGRLDEAEAAMRQAIELRSKLFGPDSARAGQSWSELGNVLREQGRLEAAGEALEQALRSRERELGPDHPDVAFSLAHLSSLYQTLEDWDRALALRLRARDIFVGSLGADHQNVAYLNMGCASLMMHTDRLDEAEELARRAVAGLEATLGPEHHWTGQAYNALAEVLMRQGEYEEAKVVGRRGLGILEAALGAENATTLPARHTLAILAHRSGDFGTAIGLLEGLEASVRKVREAAGSTLPGMRERELRLDRAECLADAGRGGEAIELVQGIAELGFPPADRPSIAKRYDELRERLGMPAAPRDDGRADPEAGTSPAAVAQPGGAEANADE